MNRFGPHLVYLRHRLGSSFWFLPSTILIAAHSGSVEPVARDDLGAARADGISGAIGERSGAGVGGDG